MFSWPDTNELNVIAACLVCTTAFQWPHKQHRISWRIKLSVVCARKPQSKLFIVSIVSFGCTAIMSQQISNSSASCSICKTKCNMQTKRFGQKTEASPIWSVHTWDSSKYSQSVSLVDFGMADMPFFLYLTLVCFSLHSKLRAKMDDVIVGRGITLAALHSSG